ncbi:GNAT family N-acetyltransferase [Brevibacillus choshinensis]|uniref:GNAT family N-acetyltransferase n=1 Tax=Brevibacillus choshinensis TaxID=54911 RepID=UPI002E219A66|nr:GNAT family N-acetyltransferase [Brevibacillus choshinensis]MED4586712.1 GNAT family N-acetyltransferase [Brevibacillus choshinensis]MED4754757.1 GNAT family N-acetyltransferase [Brevibacillus choshinensis]MED4784746.1 GNAT family N-acetyltransferase [Brevibacillus choshinensis]
MSDGSKQYVGKDIDVIFHPGRCVHSAKCVSGLPGVFNIKKKPWVHVDGETADKIASQINNCPSGALEYVWKSNLLNGGKQMFEIKEGTNCFYVGEEDRKEAEIHYVKNGNHIIIVDHTIVSDSLSGQGVGQALVKRLVEFARAKGIKIMPLCPFAKSQFDRHEDYADVLL